MLLGFTRKIFDDFQGLSWCCEICHENKYHLYVLISELCLSPEESQRPIWGLTAFPWKSFFVIGRIKKTHSLPLKIEENVFC